ncbi:M23 family metallopeptidase [Roseibium marinum]|uniref:Murein DD-endopeptidase MepM/ murein hydrolase activator NlpD n=1 Tax=Roseibium marinum TaxID=281252 RepID=A0A2S3UR85_9HYPH|nr:M23 family metallopeptidase [Roseibium marinum]POF30227.1 murein DD-endopeptidase MepM/ murein hydrolase activator NlpD [Roseibium marinum]
MRQRQNTTRPYQAPWAAPHHPAPDKNAKTTTYSVRPLHLICGALVCVTATLAAAGTIGYFLLRHDMMVEASSERTELVLEYQDRIDRLRAEIEILTSRQMVDRETVEIKVMDVLRRQQGLNQRHAIVADLVARAESNGIYLSSDQPLPPQKPALDSSNLASIEKEDKSAIGGESQLIDEPVKALGLRDGSSKGFDPLTILRQPVSEPPQSNSSVKKNLEKQAALDAVRAHISAMDEESTVAVDAITIATESRIEDILGITRTVTPSVNAALRSKTSIGGPFQPITDENFPDRLQRANKAIDALRRIKFTALRLPIKRPVQNSSVSSTYGPRVDPFLGRLAMHTGIDFKAPYGARVFATAPGTVIGAGRHGGYGKMVEIRHANGFVTRYAHLSRLRVSEGDHVLAGDLIGNVGSTGRSTGAHLHYEIRRGDKPSNPAAFLSAGDKLAALSL